LLSLCFLLYRQDEKKNVKYYIYGKVPFSLSRLYREDKKSALGVFIVVAITKFTVGICFPVFVRVYILEHILNIVLKIRF